MKKKFLDYLYKYKAGLESLLESERSKRNNPIPKCCKNMLYVNECEIKIRQYESELNVLNSTIENYIEIHTP